MAFGAWSLWVTLLYPYMPTVLREGTRSPSRLSCLLVGVLVIRGLGASVDETCHMIVVPERSKYEVLMPHSIFDTRFGWHGIMRKVHLQLMLYFRVLHNSDLGNAVKGKETERLWSPGRQGV